jgi:hypothetical protein
VRALPKINCNGAMVASVECSVLQLTCILATGGVYVKEEEKL